jgi:hypothetical protein
VSTVPGIGCGRSCGRFVPVAVGTDSMRTRRGIELVHQPIVATADEPHEAEAAPA